MDIATVPLLHEGEWNRDLLRFAEGRDTVSSTHIREGIVIRPEREGFDEKLGRRILKYISDEYFLRKGGTEYH